MEQQPRPTGAARWAGMLLFSGLATPDGPTHVLIVSQIFSFGFGSRSPVRTLYAKVEET